ncbi:IS30 family transposase [Paraclostridium bifermentans]|uniref:IS30 family transposase n=1 Tax=Paraclostridium bifermentans TaxID=1490 RepID=A0A5P3XG13_PARBF|nr:IS30 family transposase [Paraclostridium bifermentans]QEZ69310.1 IS30 family transposase [Paraclostridium bifermentans]
MSHTHFNIEERESILKYLSQGISINKIATLLGRNKSSISRELKRNSVNGFYSPSRAQNSYNYNKSRCGRKNILENNIKLKEAIVEGLKSDWSPEQITGRFKLDKKFSISFKTIYRAIDSDLLEVSKKEVLRRKGKSKKHGTTETRGKIPNKKMIDERPFSPEDRNEVGHFESDTVIGVGRKGAIATHVDRKSRYLLASIMPNRKSATFSDHTVRMFKDIPKSFVKTFTCDNGKEFARFKEIEEQLDSLVYFANPYHSWERGTNENINGLLRQYFPKGYNFKNITKEDLDIAIHKINNRPRKVLGFRTAHEVFWNEINKGCCN